MKTVNTSRTIRRNNLAHRLCLSLLGMTMATGLAFGRTGGKNAPKAPLEPVQEFDPLYLGTFNTGVKSSDVYTEGNMSFVVPVWSSLGSDGFLGGGTVFVSPYASLGEEGELAMSLGLGWRYLFSDQPVSAMKSSEPAGFLTEGFYVGANVFVDNLRTQFDNDFWQLGIGAEIGTRYLEVRGNYYLPFDSSRKLAERNTRTDTFVSQSSRSSTSSASSESGLSSPFATGHTIQQANTFTNVATTVTRTTTTRTTVRTVTSLFEEGMEGWDIEASVLIPGLDQYLDVSLIGGYYSFDNQPFGPQRGSSGNTEGWKAGIEIRPVPAIVLTGMWYEDERLTGSDWVAGIGLQIPLSRDWADAFKPRRRHLIERMAEPVARQNAAIKTSRNVDVDQKVVATKSSTKTSVRRTVTQSEQRIVIAEDIVFVNNGDAVDNGINEAGTTQDGTAENPFSTIQQGATLAGNNSNSTGRVWNVYTQAGASSYTNDVVLTGSTNFISSATPIISTVDGSQFGGFTGRPELNGGFIAIDIPTFSISDYVIDQGAVTIDAGWDLHAGVYILTNGNNSTTAVIQNSIITNINAPFINNNSSGIEVRTFDNSVLNLMVNNVLIEGSEPSGSSVTNRGINLINKGSSTMTVSIADTTILGTYGTGVLAENIGAGGVPTLNLTFAGNVNIDGRISTTPPFDVPTTNNGIALFNTDAEMFVNFIGANSISDTEEHGMTASQTGSGMLMFSAYPGSNLTIDDVGAGFFLYNPGGSIDGNLRINGFPYPNPSGPIAP